ncbi:MAG: histidine kinase [Eudoraea sp.]|uniref:sensor histidine kinase n=1 Tax=Eudoraea sp. TaxID=1979955 RepID=UPI003C715816
MEQISLTYVKQLRIVKISLIVSVLLSLPKTLFIYNMIEKGEMNFSEVSVFVFIVQFIFYFIFSWLVLQLCANWSYQLIKSPPSRIIGTILAGTAILIGILYLMDLVYPFFTGETISKREMGFLFFNYFIVFTVLFFVARILRLEVIRKENLVENEHLKQQSLQNELTALKNQIDPHFLFNSLNSLNSLIRDNKEATTFVTKLSFMYRYILQSGDQNKATIKEELKFLESYVHLIKTRYRNRFSLEISIDEAYLDKEIPPLALQTLVENAIKHNEISETNPLTVRIYSKDETICIENPIRPRTNLAEGTGSGLSNLEKRYFLLGKQKIAIFTENNIFCVQLPILKTV